MRDGRTDNEQLKIELLSQWKLEAEFRNFLRFEFKIIQNIQIIVLNCRMVHLPLLLSPLNIRSNRWHLNIT